MLNIERNYNSEDWCVDKHDCEDQCGFETKQDDKDHSEKKQPYDPEFAQLDRDNWNMQSDKPKNWYSQ